MYAVDNIFVGHDAAQAKKFAAETFHVKKPLEQAAEGSADEDDDDEPSALVDKIRLKVYEFIRKLIIVVRDEIPKLTTRRPVWL